VLWNNTINSGGNMDYVYGITVDTFGNVYVAGQYNGSDTQMFNQTGTLLWAFRQSRLPLGSS
jgi:hypothetical protein